MRVERIIASAAVLMTLYGFEGCQSPDCVPGAINGACVAFPDLGVQPDGGIDGGGPNLCSPQTEACNGRDDDCDGRVDEEQQALPTVCGDDICDARGETVCRDGQWVDTCVPRVPEAERCDGVDNDCNGVIDDLGGEWGNCYRGPEGTLGVGTCRAGRWACDAASGVATCVGEVTPRVEDIDDPWSPADEDCDGTVDEVDIGCMSCGEPTISVSVDDLDDLAWKVIVFLDAASDPPDDRAARRASIAEERAAVISEVSGLAEVNGQHFEADTSYSFIYAFAAEADRASLNRLVRHPRVSAVIENPPVETSLLESTALVGAVRARREGGVDGRGARVALIDTGVDHTHPAFGCEAAGAPGCRVLEGHSVPPDSPRGPDLDGHGTAVASVIAGSAVGAEPAGMAPGAEIYPVQVNRPVAEWRVYDIFAALASLVDHPLEFDVINISVSTESTFLEGNQDLPDDGSRCQNLFRQRELVDVLTQLSGRAVIVAPTGNAGHPRLLGFPACWREVFAVGAVYDEPIAGEVRYGEPSECNDPRLPIGGDGAITADYPACFSNGTLADAGMIDLFAPGAMIRTALTGGGYGSGTGTSLAAAHVSGAVALLASGWPNETAGERRDRLVLTAAPLPPVDVRPGEPALIQVGRLEMVAALDRQCFDGDGDGYGVEGPDCRAPLDCDDDDYTAHPGATERCDHVDNDCDGETDEDLGVGVECELGVGACHAMGVQVCSEGGVICDARTGEPSDEVCDGIDNDCDGQADEGFGLGEACAVGQGACHRSGARVCGAGGIAMCSVEAGQPVAEQRDRLDNDCDGSVDEGTCEDVTVQEGQPDEILNCNEGYDVGRDYVPDPEGVDACMADNQEGCDRDNLAAWCNRAESELNSRWTDLFEQYLLEHHPECEVADTIRIGDDKYSVCTRFVDGICPGSYVRYLTPLIIRYGAYAHGPHYAKASGRFDLSRHQDGSAESTAWVADPFLIMRPASDEPLTARHLFGEATLDHDGKPRFVDGFDALATMADLDGDGWVTGRELEPLAEWTDHDADRAVDEGEIVGLTDRGVIAIRVEPFDSTRTGWHPNGLGFVEGRSRLYWVDAEAGQVRAGEVMDVYLR